MVSARITLREQCGGADPPRHGNRPDQPVYATHYPVPPLPPGRPGKRKRSCMPIRRNARGWRARTAIGLNMGECQFGPNLRESLLIGLDLRFHFLLTRSRPRAGIRSGTLIEEPTNLDPGVTIFATDDRVRGLAWLRQRPRYVHLRFHFLSFAFSARASTSRRQRHEMPMRLPQGREFHGDEHRSPTPRIVAIGVPERPLNPLASMLIAIAIGTAGRYMRLLSLTRAGVSVAVKHSAGRHRPRWASGDSPVAYQPSRSDG
jgi:hypothetical protein